MQREKGFQTPTLRLVNCLQIPITLVDRCGTRGCPKIVAGRCQFWCQLVLEFSAFSCVPVRFPGA